MFHYNPLPYINRLKEAGFTQQQATVKTEGIMGILGYIDPHFATKEDLNNLDLRLSSKINHVDTTLNWLLALIGVMGGCFSCSEFCSFSHVISLIITCPKILLRNL